MLLFIAATELQEIAKYYFAILDAFDMEGNMQIQSSTFSNLIHSINGHD